MVDFKSEHETLRLEALRSYDILDSDPESAFDELTKLASLLFGTPIATVNAIKRYAHGIWHELDFNH